MVLVVLIVVGVGGVGGGGTALALELTRHATPAEANAAGQQELATLWERLTAGQIFPPTISYQTSSGYVTTATLAGIAPRTSCAVAADPSVAQALGPPGCVTMLRATYTDATRTVLATVGIAVMRGTGAARRAYNASIASDQSHGVRVVAFPGTAAAGFTNSAREVFGADVSGPYVFFFTAGYADGRSTTLETTDGETAALDLGTGVRTHLIQTFVAPAKPCANRYIAC